LKLFFESEWLLDISKENSSSHKEDSILFDLVLLWVLLVYLRALFTCLFPPPLSHRPPHPEIYSVGAVPSLYNLGIIIMLCFEENPLFGRLGLETQPTKTPKTPGLASLTQAETAAN
jgi:hypothetical protein